MGNSFYYFQELFSPSGGVQMQYPILMADYTFYSKKDIDDYLTLLSQTSDYFDSLMVFETDKSKRGYFMADYSLQKVCDQCNSLMSEALLNSNSHFLQKTFAERMKQAIDSGILTKKEADHYQDVHTGILISSVLPAYEKLGKSLKALSGTGKNESGLAAFPQGKEYYPSLYDIFKEERCTQLAMLSLLDMGIHYYGFSYERVKEILSAYGITEEEQIRNIYEYIVEEPANYPKYYWSYLQFKLLKKKAEEIWGSSYNDCRFHTFLLQSGPSDFQNLEKRLQSETNRSSQKTA